MNAKPKRSWFRFSLRTLLVLVTFAAVGFAWLGVKVRANQREREAAKAIRESGGRVDYDIQHDQTGNWLLLEDTHPPAPAWLRKLFGDDLFTEVVRVYLGGETSGEDLRRLPTTFHHLRFLHLNGPQFTDDALVHLMGLNRLEELNLDGSDVTDAGLNYLRGLTKLKCLYLRTTRVTGAGVEELQKALPNLEVIR